jgi:hypothetical protein
MTIPVGAAFVSNAENLQTGVRRGERLYTGYDSFY